MPGLFPHFWGLTFAIAPPSWSKRQSRRHLGPKGNRAAILAQKANGGQKPWRCRPFQTRYTNPGIVTPRRGTPDFEYRAAILAQKTKVGTPVLGSGTPLTELVYCVTVAFTNFLTIKGDFSFEKNEKSQGAKSY